MVMTVPLNELFIVLSLQTDSYDSVPPKDSHDIYVTHGQQFSLLLQEGEIFKTSYYLQILVAIMKRRVLYTFCFSIST